MHLDTLTLTRFRSFESASISFDPDLTVLVGENNGGKSNVLDALRLLLQPASGRMDRYCETEDLRRGADPASFEIEANFANLSPTERGAHLSLLCEEDASAARLGFTCEIKDERSQRPLFWGGRHKTPPEAGARDLVRQVYLPALRDAKQALASGNPTRKLALLSHFIPTKDQSAFLTALKRADAHDGLTQIKSAVGRELSDLTVGVREQTAELGFSNNEKLIDIARDLRFKLGDIGADPEEIAFSGLGFANLLFMATIVVELEKAQEADLTMFLVEEPEAHLHPQLQMAVLDFLHERASRVRKIAPGQPAGKIQVVVASHSPNLTSWVDSRKLVAMRTVREDGKRRSISIALKNLTLDPKERRKVDRYLDVTRAALLFGGRCVLIEGVAEALLMPAVARRLTSDEIREVKASDLAKDAQEKAINTVNARYKRFRAATLIPIEGVDFKPYVSMLLAELNGARLADKLVVVTDADGEAGANRKSELVGLARSLGAEANLSVCVSDDTLEVDLYAKGNGAAMGAAFLKLHPRSKAKWDKLEGLEGDALATSVREVFSDMRKGDFAQLLAAHVEDGGDFKPPNYIVEAIKAVWT